MASHSMRKVKSIWCADFETSLHPDGLWSVWMWYAEDVNTGEGVDGCDIESFINWCLSLDHAKILFHNLNFDGSYIIPYLANTLKYEYNQDRKTGEKDTYSFLYPRGIGILNITFGSVEIECSYKKLMASVRDLGKGQEIGKLDTYDYTKVREYGEFASVDEWEYLYHDVKTVVPYIRDLYANGENKMTCSSNGWADLQRRFNEAREDKSAFKKTFPKLDKEEDEFIRKSYRGGVTWCRPKFKNVHTGKGICCDVNSMYPAQLRYQLFPFGHGEWFDGDPDRRLFKKARPLWVARCEILAHLKDDWLPTVQQVRGRYEPVLSGELTVTSVEYQTLTESYNVDFILWHGGYSYKAAYGLFDEYIDYWMGVKAFSPKASRERTFAKLHLNSMYGKFGQADGSKHYVYDAESQSFVSVEEDAEIRKYVPVAAFTTAYARQLLARSAHANWDRFTYCDTDSMHLIGWEDPEGIEVHKTKLGAWDIESHWVDMYHIGPKLYRCWTEDGSIETRAAGIPNLTAAIIPDNDFQEGFTNRNEDGTLSTVYVKNAQKRQADGSIYLANTPFIINPRNTFYRN